MSITAADITAQPEAPGRAPATVVASNAIVIDPRCTGFPDRALGGHVAGLLAGYDPYEVRFRRPVPVGRELTIAKWDSGEKLIAEGDEQLVEASPWVPAGEIPEAPSLALARRATAAYSGHRRHLFPDCYCCGPRRGERDGLRVFPSTPASRPGIVAAAWSPAEDGGPETAWAAMDCPAIWALIAAADHDSPDRIVTGTMSGHCVKPLSAHREYVVYAWAAGSEGRKRFTGAAIAEASGEIVAYSFQTFITTPAGVPIARRLWL